MRLLEKGFYTFIRNVSFSSLTDVRFHNPPLLGAQCPRWHTVWCPALIPFVHNPNPLLVDNVHFGMLRLAISLIVFKMCLLWRGLGRSNVLVSTPPQNRKLERLKAESWTRCTMIKNVSFSCTIACSTKG